MEKMKKRKQKKTNKAKRHCEEILCAGFGGQGIMFMGKLLAHSGFIAGRCVTWMPSYGAEVRGGTAYSMTKISDNYIANPIVTNPDILIAMNEPSFVKYGARLKDGGILISNKSLISGMYKRKGILAVSMPMTEIAHKLGDKRSANMVALGALVKRSRMISIRDVISALKNIFKDKHELFEINKKALEKGYRR